MRDCSNTQITESSRSFLSISFDLLKEIKSAFVECGIETSDWNYMIKINVWMNKNLREEEKERENNSVCQGE